MDRGKPVATAIARVEVHKFPHLPRVLAGWLEPEVLDERRAEALLVLQLHRVKHTTVAVNADEELARARQMLKLLDVMAG